jgi:phospholipase/carboxylesterase
MMNSKLFEYSTTDKPKYLVILLHGYGSSGENLINLSHELKYALPDAHYISPNAIAPWEGGFPDSYQWFSLYSGSDRKDLPEIAAEIRNANKILTNFIDAQLARFNLSDDKLFIVGFSQGAMMSMYQGFIKPKKPAGIIAFSGKLILPEMLGQQTLSQPNICLIHGESDSVVPFENFLEAKKLLERQENTHEFHAIPHLDHSIDIHGIRMAQKFIKKIIS